MKYYLLLADINPNDIFKMFFGGGGASFGGGSRFHSSHDEGCIKLFAFKMSFGESYVISTLTLPNNSIIGFILSSILTFAL